MNMQGKKSWLLNMLFNPLDKPITRTLTVPVYYTGLWKQIKITDPSGKSQKTPRFQGLLHRTNCHNSGERNGSLCAEPQISFTFAEIKPCTL